MTRRALPLLLLVLAAACGGEADRSQPAIAEELRPYPFTTPTPPREATPLDGTYRREVTDEIAGPPGKCVRCPPYRLELGDTNTLMIEEGAFLVQHDVTPWRSYGHVLVDGDRVSFFNDPNCMTTRGEYRWRIEGETLSLEVVEDSCPFAGLRRRYLTITPWTRT